MTHRHSNCCKDHRVTVFPGVDRLRGDFNEWSNAVRVLAMLSPTCQECLAGYELLLRMPPATTRLVLWTAMKDGDSISTVATLIDDDKHCTHYWEDEGWPVSTRLTSTSWLGSA